MNLSNLLDDVQEITRRPDARSRGTLALNAILVDICTKAKYGEDLIEMTIPNPGTSLTAAISLNFDPALYPVVRSISYVLPENDSAPLRQATPKNALEAVNSCCDGVYYRSGTNLIVHARLGWTELRFGYYRAVPRLAEATGKDSHWLLDTDYAMLLNGTVARVFRAVGDDDSAGYYEQLFRDQLLTFRRDRGETED